MGKAWGVAGGGLALGVESSGGRSQGWSQGEGSRARSLGGKYLG